MDRRQDYAKYCARGYKLLLLIACLGLSAWADPWDTAGEAPAESTMVVAWSLSGKAELLPFWKLALRIDDDAMPEDRLRWAQMLDGLELSLEQWLQRFDGSGRFLSHAPSGLAHFSFGLAAKADLASRLSQRLGSDGSDFQRSVGDDLALACSSSELSIRLGPKLSQTRALKSDQAFLDARSRLGSRPCDILLFAHGQGAGWEYAALSVDLKGQVAYGFWKFPPGQPLPATSGLDQDILGTRPGQLATFLAVDLDWLEAGFDRLSAALPSRLQGVRQFLAARRAPGGLLETFHGQGLVGTTDDLTAFLVGVQPSSSFYAVGRYRDLGKVESFLGDLEYDTRLHALEGCEKNLEDLAWALARWEVDLGREVPQDLGALVPEMLPAVPDCPAVGRPTYLASKDGSLGRLVVCKGHHHPQTPADFPRFSQRHGLERGEFRPRAELPQFSRLDATGRAAYRLSSGQRLSVDPARRLVYLADGPLDREFLASPAQIQALPALARDNADWGGDRLIYLDHAQLQAGLPRLHTVSQVEYPGTLELLIAAFLEGQRQAGTSEASNAFRREDDGLAYRGAGLWASPALLSPLAGVSVGIRAVARQEALDLAQACRDNLRQISQALDAYAKGHDGRYPDQLADLVPGYLPELPICPAASSDTYSAGYQWDQYSRFEPASSFYTVCCKGQYHRRARCNEDQPSYSSESGWSSQ
jgi:hypothetical protein